MSERLIHPSLISQGKIFEEAAEIAQKEKNKAGWGVMDTGLDKYSALMSLFNIPNVVSLIEKRRKITDIPAILDVMGFGTMFYELQDRHVSPTYGCSISLDHWKVQDPWYSSEENTSIRHVTGNILHEETWDHLDAQKKELQVSAFDFVFWRPLFGLNPRYITRSLHVYNELLSRVYEQVHANSGFLLMELPGWVFVDHENAVKQWHDGLEKISTISKSLFDTYGVFMVIEKTPELPLLPKIGGHA